MAAITQELLSRRNAREKHFATEDPEQFITRIFARPIHFKNDQDEWKEREELWSQTADGWVWGSKDLSYGIEGGYLALTYKGRSLTMRPNSIAMVDRTAPATRFRKLADANYSNVTRNGNVFTVNNIFPHTDFRVRFTDRGFDKDFIVSQKPNLPDPSALGWNPANTYLVIVWEVNRPAGAVVKDAETYEVVSNGYAGKNDLLIQNAVGETIFTFRAGTATSSHVNPRRRSGPVWYVVAGANVPFGEAIPYSRAVIATYPLTIDPTTTIYGANADDGYLYRTDGGPWYVATGTTAIYVNSDSWDAWDDGKGGGYPAGSLDDVGYLRFNTASLSGQTISAVSVNVYWGSMYSTKRFAVMNSDWGTLEAADANITTKPSYVDKTAIGSGYTSAAMSASEVLPFIGSYVPIKVTNSTAGQSDWFYAAENSGTGSDPYLSVTYTSITTWVIPPTDGANETDTTPTLNYGTAITSGVSHIGIQLDTSNSFNTGNLRDIRSDVDATGFEYWDGSAWQTLTTSGIPAAHTGNPGRYTPSALPIGTWYRRIRQTT